MIKIANKATVDIMAERNKLKNVMIEETKALFAR